MINDEIREQLHGDIRELELTAGEYPRDCFLRYVFLGYAAVLKQFDMSDNEKLELMRTRLESLGPCLKREFIESLDFTRDEGRRLVDIAIDAGIFDAFPDTEPTNGRRATMLRVP